jgi:hypothetical protein
VVALLICNERNEGHELLIEAPRRASIGNSCPFG